MVSITQDPKNPNQLIVTQTVTIFLDKILVSSLSEELAAIIRQQAHKDLKKNKTVQQAVAEAASKKLLTMLGVGNDSENNPGTPGVSGS